MVRFGFFDFLPIAVATKVLNFDSFAFGGPFCACCFASEPRLDCEEFARVMGVGLKDLDLHHDLPCVEEEAAMRVMRKEERALLKESDYC